jgi:hypothetical protein
MPLNNQHIRMDDCEIWTPERKIIVVNNRPEFLDHFMADKELVSADNPIVTGCAPIIAGHVPDPENYSQHIDEYFNLRALPLKKAGEDIFRIPNQLAPLYGNTIKAMAEKEYARSQFATFKHAFLFLSRSYVHASASQRDSFWHQDNSEVIKAMLGNKISLKIPAHSYLTSDFSPTQLQSRPIPNATEIFTKAARADVAEGLTFRLTPYQIALMNDYVWHRGMKSETGGMRSFVNVMFLADKEVEDMLARAPQPLVFKSSLDF